MAKTRRDMGSEFLREAAVLVLIFAMLDKVVVRGHGLVWVVSATTLILAISALLFWLGVFLEESSIPLSTGEEEKEEEEGND